MMLDCCVVQRRVSASLNKETSIPRDVQRAGRVLSCLPSADYITDISEFELSTSTTLAGRFVEMSLQRWQAASEADIIG
jgi:hypothetical protein